jgi:hypothetical protein
MRKLTLVLVIFCAVISVAQETKTQDGKAAESKTASTSKTSKAQKPAATTMKPSPEMVRLAENLAGRWIVEGRQEATPEMPADTGSGKEFIHRGPGNQSIISDMQMNFDKAGRITGHGVIYWNPVAKAYKGFWCESMSPVCEDAGTGRWDGNNLVFEGDVMMNGQKVATRQTYSQITHDGFTWTMEANGPEGMKPLLTFTYKRQNRSSSDKDAQMEGQPKMLKDEATAKSKD